jgi:glycosyltransferase involved in cell wall biosynthesis
LLPDDEFVCLTEVGSEALTTHLKKLKFPKVRVHTIPHLLYLDEPIAPRLKTTAAPAKIGFFGFINPNKGLSLLIDAAIHLAKTDGKKSVPEILVRGRAAPNAEKYLEAQKIKTRQAELSDQIHFGDFLSDAELPTFLRSIDALALPYRESPVISASGVLQWARTFGVPVAASQTKAFSALILHQVDGWLLPQNDALAWSMMLGKIAAEPLLLQELSKGMLKRQSEATWKSVAALVAQKIGLRNA